MSGSEPRRSLSLEPPRKSIELVDPGAHDLQSSEGEEYFSDASEGRRHPSRPITPSSPIPRTRIEKVDHDPRHGEVPGTSAYDKRIHDAVPDEVEVVPEGRLSKRSSQYLEPPLTPGGSVIPRTVVEKVDPSSPSYGEDPDTTAYQKRQADAVPDVVLRSPEAGKRQRMNEETGRERAISDVPIPETVITRVDSIPAHGEIEGTAAYDMRKRDAKPDILEKTTDLHSPASDRSMTAGRRASPSPQNSDNDNDQDDTNDLGDDFDDFEEGAQAAADDDFGDFDDGFQEPDVEPDRVIPESPSQITTIPSPSHSLIDFDALSSLPDLLTATQMHFDAMFPSTTREHVSTLSDPEAIPDSSPIFPSDRSRSLWKQLVTPPPLQPPNWTQSRIRRLFLVSLGVPVDLDEILPPSKQKKLILPDINLEHSSSRRSESDRALGSVARLKAQAANDSTGSLDSTQSQPGTANPKRSRKTKGPAPPPDLDLVAVKRLCATTNEKLDGFTDDELQAHVKQLEGMTEKTSELLEYWLKRRDGLRKEKEAFEGVIENLVAHVRRVRR